MDVNFSSTSFSPPRPSSSSAGGVRGIKTEPSAPSLFLDTHTHPSSSKRASRGPTNSPATPFRARQPPSALAQAEASEKQRYTPLPRPSAAVGDDDEPEEPEQEQEQEPEGEGEQEGDEQTRLEEEVYRAQQAAQGRAKANLKVLMDHFSEEQQTRYDWYRRSTLNKSNVRKLIQSTGTLVTPQVAQMVAGVGKVFVGEIVERALQVQADRGEQGPLAPEHLRQAYQMYRDEKGVVGAARPQRGKRLAL